METLLTTEIFSALARTAAQGCVALALALTACWIAAAGFRQSGAESEAK